MTQLDAALDLAAKAWPVFPCGDDKRPLGTLAEHGFKDATTNPRRIKMWWRIAPDALIGVALVKNTMAVDVDNVGLFEKSGLSLPTAPEQRTRSGGFHRLYATDPARVVPQTVKKHPGTDTRIGGRGYIIGWSPEIFPTPDDLPLAPDWVYDEEDEHPTRRKSKNGVPAEEMLIGEDGVTHRTNITSWVGTLRGIANNTDDEILQLLLGRLASGQIIDGDETRPWTPADMEQIVRGTKDWQGPEREREFKVNRVKAEVTEEVEVDADAARPAPASDTAFYGPLGRLTLAMDGYSEADPIGLLVSLMTVVGCAMGRERRFHEGFAQGANLFVVQVGESGTGRKGTTLRLTRDILKPIFDLFDISVGGFGSGESLVAALDQQKPEPRALVIEEEFAGMLTTAARDSSILSQVMRRAFDGWPLERRTVAVQQKISDHHVSVLAHVTPVELRARLSTTEAANGFGNRFLWIYTGRTRIIPRPADPEDVCDPRDVQLVREAVAWSGTTAAKKGSVAVNRRTSGVSSISLSKDLYWTDDAREAWDEWYTSQESSRTGESLLDHVLSRASVHVLRLALVFALVDRARTIDVPHLQAALAVWDYSARSARYVFGTSTGNRNADALMRFLRREGAEVPWMEARRELGVRTSADMDDAISSLVSTGLVEVVTKTSKQASGAGRKMRVIRLKAGT